MQGMQASHVQTQFSLLKRILSSLIGLILVLDGAYLISLKKIHFGTVLPVLIGMMLLCYAIFYTWIQSYLKQHTRLDWLWKFGWGVFWLWCISLLIFFTYIHFSTQQQNTVTNNAKVVIVLGSGIENGQPSPTLAKRLDTAAAYALEHPQSYFIVSGGPAFAEQLTEAQVMSNYLQQRYAIAASHIILETQSTSTALNLKNSQPLLHTLGTDKTQPIIIVTSDFHTPRAAAIAKRQGYTQFSMLSATTPLYTRYNAWLREYFAYISGWLLNEY